LVSNRCLLDRFELAVQLRHAVDGIDGGDHGIEPEIGLEDRILHQRVQDRRRIGEAGGLDHHALERRHFAAHAPEIEGTQRVHEVAADRTAQAARAHQHGLAVDLLDQFVVETDLAEFVDQHGGLAHAGMAQKLAEQRGLAAAEEAGEDGDGDGDPAFVGGGCGIGHDRRYSRRRKAAKGSPARPRRRSAAPGRSARTAAASRRVAGTQKG
jgi:hypothetical protein